MKEQVQCEICTRFHTSTYKRYGGYCCSPCALFFRRSVNRHQKYVCFGNDEKCLKKPSKLGSLCRKCRWKKCLDLGMYIHGMAVPASVPSTATATLTQPPAASTPVVSEPHPPPAFTQEFVEEMFLFAETINAILETSLKYPDLLRMYYLTENRCLYDFAAQNFENICTQSMPRIDTLLGVMLKYPITYEELDLFCSICISKLKFYNEPRLTELQTNVFKKILSKNKMEEKRLLELFTISEHCLEKFN